MAGSKEEQINLSELIGRPRSTPVYAPRSSIAALIERTAGRYGRERLLTAEQHIEVAEAFRDGEPLATLGRRHGVSASSIQVAIRRVIRAASELMRQQERRGQTGRPAAGSNGASHAPSAAASTATASRAESPDQAASDADESANPPSPSPSPGASAPATAADTSGASGATGPGASRSAAAASSASPSGQSQAGPPPQGPPAIGREPAEPPRATGGRAQASDEDAMIDVGPFLHEIFGAIMPLAGPAKVAPKQLMQVADRLERITSIMRKRAQYKSGQ